MIERVGYHNGRDLTSVALGIMSDIGITAFTTEEFHSAYEELIRDGEIIAMKFTDPATPAGSKTILFSKGTKFLNLAEINNGQETTSDKTDLVR